MFRMLIEDEPMPWSSALADEDLQMFPELGPPLEDEATLPGNDFLEALSSDLEIPMLLTGEGSPRDDESPNEIISNAMKSFEDFLRDNNTSEPTDDFTSILTDVSEEVIIKDVKLEPCSPEFVSCKLPPSPSPSQSESSSGSEYQSEDSTNNHCNNKFAIETPPISPPQTESPPTSPVPLQNNPPTLQKVKLFPINSINLKDGSSQKFIFSKNNPAKRFCIQPKLDQTTSKDNSRKTIVLSPQDFAALTQKVKQSSGNQSLKVQTLPINKSVKVQNNINSLPIQANTIPTQNNQIKIINAMTPSLQINSKTPSVSMLNPIITKNDVKSFPKIVVKKDNISTPPSIVIKNDVPVCPPIVMKKDTTNFLPVVIKNEFPEFIDYHDQDRQDSELKALKRQQRMIKNRESACLSRKKKKEYVTSLENEISELKEHNRQLTVENAELKKRLSRLEGNSNKKYVTQSYGVNKKNTAVFCAFLFIVSFNFGSLGMLSLKQPPLTDDQSSATIRAEKSMGRGSRTLLWSTTDEEDNAVFKENLNDTRTMYLPMCPGQVNATESERMHSLLSELRNTKSSYGNGKKPSKADLTDDSNNEYLEKNYISNKNLRDLNLKPRLKRQLKQLQKNKSRMNQIAATSGVNAVQVFSHFSENYVKLSDILGKKDDTLYLVYFTEKDFFLPASRTNHTIRPKMTLVVPTVSVDGTIPQDHISMIKIDCEVLNTQLLNLPENIIREYSRKHQSNDSQEIDNNVDITEGRHSNEKVYKPYTLREYTAASINKNVVKKEFISNSRYNFYSERNKRKNEESKMFSN